MARPNAPLPDSLPHSVFTATEARWHGVSYQRLCGRDLARVHRGIYKLRDADISEADIVAALCRRYPSAFAVGLTAARLWGFPLPGFFEESVTSAPSPQDRAAFQRSSRKGQPTPELRIHLSSPDGPRPGNGLIRWSEVEIPRSRLVEAKGVRLPSRLETFLGLRSSLQLDALVAIGDHLVRNPRFVFEERQDPYLTIEQLRIAAAAARGRHIKRIREAVELVRTSADSPAETTLRLAMIRAGLPEPGANVRIVDGTEDLGEPDLSWPQYRVILEHEGRHHLKPEQQRRDIARTEKRVKQGWIEVRTTATDLERRCLSAIRRVTEALKSHGWPGAGNA